jgi:hypothetical protein
MKHIASLSGGLDSSIMYLYLTGYLKGGPKIDGPLEAVFTDPGKEHPRTYAMLDTLEAMTKTKITRLKGPTWEEALEAHAWFLPFHRARWCTGVFKIQPFQAYVGEDKITSYIGLRADEPKRKGYLGDRGHHITPAYILRQMGISRTDIESEAKRTGLPPPALWSCGCCPFKTHYHQVLMIKELPAMAEWMAWVEQQKRQHHAGGYTWVRGYTMRELIDNSEIRTRIRRRWWSSRHHVSQAKLWDEVEQELTPCLMCQVK